MVVVEITLDFIWQDIRATVGGFKRMMKRFTDF